MYTYVCVYIYTYIYIYHTPLSLAVREGMPNTPLLLKVFVPAGYRTKAGHIGCQIVTVLHQVIVSRVSAVLQRSGLQESVQGSGPGHVMNRCHSRTIRVLNIYRTSTICELHCTTLLIDPFRSRGTLGVFAKTPGIGIA